MMLRTSRLVRVGSTRILTVATTFAFGSLLSYLVSSETFGVVATILSATLFAAALGEFGLRDVTARDVAIDLANDETVAASLLASVATCLGIATGCLAAMGLFPVLSILLGDPLIAATGSLIAVALAVNGVWSGIGRGRGQYFWSLLPRDVLWRLLTLVCIGTLLMLGANASPTHAALALATSLLLALIAQYTTLGASAFDSRFDFVRAQFVARAPALLASGASVMLLQLADILLVNLDIVFVSAIGGPNAAAEYFPANRTALLAFSLHTMLQLTLGPQLAQMVAGGRKAEAGKSARSAARMAALFAIAATIGVTLFGNHFLPVLFATSTRTTYVCAVVLCLGYCVYATAGFGASLLIAAKQEHALRSVSVVSTAAGLTLIAAGAWLGGPIGVAVAIAITMSAKAVLIALRTRAILGVSGSVV